jgi:TolB-like protein
LRYFFSGCVLDTDRRELSRGTDLIPLSPQVFDLLHYLIRNREHVVSKDDLIAAVWDGRIVSDAALTTRLNVARSAIGDSGEEQRLIKTLPRKGLRFVGEVREQQELSAAVARNIELPKPALTVPDKPSIAVLPFTNMSGDPQQEYFADGMVEEITTALSRSRHLFVIARNSSFTYKGRAVDIRQVARELGVRYVLEGSVRCGGNRVRVTAQLVDAATANHLWADRYDRDLSDIFAVQDDITEAIGKAVEPKVGEMERRRAVRKPPESLDAWEAYQRGLWHLARVTAADHQVAKDLFRRAIDLDPNFAPAHAELAIAILYGAPLYQMTSIAEALDEAAPIAQRAIDLDPHGPTEQVSVGLTQYYVGNHDAGSIAFRRALAISPNYAVAHHVLGMCLLFSGQPREALEPIREATRLDPFDPLGASRASNIAIAHYYLREYEAAVIAAKEALGSGHLLAYRWLAAALGQIGRREEAKQALADAIALTPKSVDMFVRQRVPWMRPVDYEHMVEGLRKAGWRG